MKDSANDFDSPTKGLKFSHSPIELECWCWRRMKTKDTSAARYKEALGTKYKGIFLWQEEMN